MVVYIIVIGIVLLTCILQSSERKVQHRNFAILMILLALFVGLSDMLGGFDRYIYGSLFDELSNSAGRIGATPKIHKLYADEKGYIALNYMLSYFTSNRYIFILLVTLLTYTLFYVAISEESENPVLSLVLFLGLYFFFTFTYLRQALAVAIIWCSYRYIVRRKLLPYCLLMILAFSCHNSSIIFFPMYFLVKKMPSVKMIIGVGLALLAIGITELPSRAFDIYEAINDTSRRVGVYTSDTSGFRFEYALEAVVFLCYLLYNHKFVSQQPREIVHYNTALCFCAILLIFCSSINGGRLSWPFMLGLICTLTSIMNRCRKDSFTWLSLTSLALILYVRILLGWGVLLSPYKTFLTPGTREGDYIHRRFEYNHRYDHDKFCR